MKTIAIVPSYDRPQAVTETLRGLDEVVMPTGVLTLLQPKGAPLGSGEARRRLAEQAAREGADLILSLDDDCRFVSAREDYRAAERHFEDDPTLGIVQLLNSAKPPIDRLRLVPFAYHVFVIRADLIREGMNYDPAEYADEVSLSLRAWLAGWRIGVSGRARVLHHVTPRGRQAGMGGGREGAFAEGLVPIVSTFAERFVETGLVTCTLGQRAGVTLPTPYASIRVTQAARAEHAAARARRGWR